MIAFERLRGVGIANNEDGNDDDDDDDGDDDPHMDDDVCKSNMRKRDGFPDGGKHANLPMVIMQHPFLYSSFRCASISRTGTGKIVIVIQSFSF